MSSLSIKQRDATDCGAACLCAIARYHKLKIPVARIRQFAGTDQKGTNVMGLLSAAERLGFDAKGVKGTLESLKHIPYPAIAHVVTNSQFHHYVVICGINSKKITIMDPIFGKVFKRTIEDFAKDWSGVLLIMLPNQDFKTKDKQMSIASRFCHLLQQHKGVVVQVIIGSILYTMLGLAISIYIQKIIDHVLVNGDKSLLNIMSIIMVVLFLAQGYIGTIKNLFVMRTGQQLDAQLILGYYRHILKLPLQFFESRRIGELISRVNDAMKIRAYINEGIIHVIVNVLILFFSFTLMFSYYWKLGLLMLLIIPIYLTIYLIANQFYKKINRKLMEQSAELESLLVENIRTIGTIKRFDLASFVYTKIETKFIKLLKTGYQSGLTTIVSSTSVEVCSHLFTILLLWAGTGHVLDREITPGELFSFYALIGYFTSPAAALIGSNKIIQEAFIAADRLFEIMDLQIDSPQQGIELQRAQLGDIRFEKVAFGYNNRSKVFEGLDLTIKIGQLTAIVGESGSGKSTIMSLLQQLYPLMEGKIYIGKYPLQHIDQEALGKLMAVVPQDVDLFAGTITANIAIGEYRPDMGRIVDICTQLAILDFIHTLPKGFDTELGENGATLSGGQKQKIALARALYRDPEILILDEATSALDSQSEFVIRNTLDLLVQKGKTIIVIAHRLSIIKHAHHIILLQNGGVMEEGTHAELMSRPNHYHDLWTKQFGNELISSTPI